MNRGSKHSPQPAPTKPVRPRGDARAATRGLLATILLLLLAGTGSLIAVMAADAKAGPHGSNAATSSGHRRLYVTGGVTRETPATAAHRDGREAPSSTPSTSPCLTIQKLQKISAGAYTTSELNAKEGETVDYKIIVKNTGDTELILSGFTDVKCTDLAGGASKLAVSASTTWTCEHKLAAPGKYQTSPRSKPAKPFLRERCDGPYGEPTKCDGDKRYGQDHEHSSYSKGHFLGKKKSDMVTVDVTTTTTTTTTTTKSSTTTTTSAIQTTRRDDPVERSPSRARPRRQSPRRRRARSRRPSTEATVDDHSDPDHHDGHHDRNDVDDHGGTPFTSTITAT